MRRSERVLTVLLIIFVALTFALVALLFVYNFVRTEGQAGVSLMVEAAEPGYEPIAADDAEYAEVVAASLATGSPVPVDAITAEFDGLDEPEMPAPQPGRVDAYTRIIFERNYVLDGIVLTTEEPIPHFAINMDRENLANVYADWEIVDFTPRQVTMRRNIVNQRAEHYVISEHNGFVAVFRQSGGAALRLIEVTRTPISSLPPGEQMRIHEGIIVQSEEALDRAIENFES